MATTTALPVLVNRQGGTAKAAGDGLRAQLEEVFAETGVLAEIKLLDGPEIGAELRRLAGQVPRVVVAGGDGTLSSAAEVLAGSTTELAILPLGTLNHLARDLGIPGDLAEAATLAAGGSAMAIDIGTVGDQTFVNNASIGLYPLLVRQREAAQERHGLPKWLASLPAAWAALERLPHHRLEIDMAVDENGGEKRPIVTPLLFLGNNRYELEGGKLGQRSSLTDGTFCVYAVRHGRRRALLWFALRALVGRLDRSRDFIAIGECAELTVHGRSGSIEIALDGEVTRLPSPLHFAIRPLSLKVVSP